VTILGKSSVVQFWKKDHVDWVLVDVNPDKLILHYEILKAPSNSALSYLLDFYRLQGPSVGIGFERSEIKFYRTYNPSRKT
jgi:hypothetical protein